MITREEALLGLDYSECIFNNKKIYVNAECMEILLNKIYDGFEQHINSLEAQLASTEQLTYSTCNPECFHYDVETSKEYCPCKNCVLYVANKHIHNYYKPKDTK